MKPQFQSSSRVQQPWAEHRALTDKTLREGGLGSAWEYLAGQEGLGCTFKIPHLGFFPLSSLREEQDLAVVSKGSVMSTQDRARPWQRHRAHSGHGEPWVFNLLKSLYFHQLFVQTYSSGRCWVQPWATIPEILNQRSQNGKNKQDPFEFFSFLCALERHFNKNFLQLERQLRVESGWTWCGHSAWPARSADLPKECSSRKIREWGTKCSFTLLCWPGFGNTGLRLCFPRWSWNMFTVGHSQSDSFSFLEHNYRNTALGALRSFFTATFWSRDRKTIQAHPPAEEDKRL